MSSIEVVQLEGGPLSGRARSTARKFIQFVTAPNGREVFAFSDDGSVWHFGYDTVWCLEAGNHAPRADWDEA